MRHCPKCQDITNVEIIGGVELDRCVSCEGILLDRGELRVLIRESVHNERPEAVSVAVDFKPAFCEDCACEMTPRSISGVRVEGCPTCGALFLDKGELAALQTSRR